MNKLILLLITVLTINTSVFSQTVIIPTGNPATTGAPSSSILRKPLGSFFGYERSAMIYTPSEIGINGTITAISFYLDAVSSPAAVPTKVYMKEVPTNLFASATTVATEESGAMLVFDQTVSTFTVGAYVNLILSTPFVYSNTNALEIIVETNATGTGTEGSTGKKFRFNSTTDNKFQYWQADNNPPTANGTIGTNRPNIKIEITPANPCIEPPYVGIIEPTDTVRCVGEPVSLALDSVSFGSGQINQWQSSTDNINWTNVLNGTGLSYQFNYASSLYIRFTTTCGATTSNSNILHFTSESYINCYCLSAASDSADDDIGNVTFNTINNGVDTPQLNNATSINTYSDFTNISTNVIKGFTYPISVSQINQDVFYDCEINAYIDFNKDGVFDEVTEKTFLGTTTSTNTVLTSNILIPTNADTGVTRMRIVLNESTGAGPCDAYTWGETEDYTIIIEDAPACVEPPTAGTTVLSDTLTCPSTVVSCSLNGSVYGNGLNYQWQTSPDGINWTNINGANNSTYSGAFSSSVYVRCEHTCGATSVGSTPKFIEIRPFYTCYCDAIHAGCDAEITNVTIIGTTLNNDSTCSPSGADAITFPASGNTTATLIKGLSYDFSITTSNTHIISVWIDYNQNGNYEVSEWFQVATNSVVNVASVKNFTVPIGALSGQTGMRVRTRLQGNPNDSTSACLNMGSGETHDYVITLVDPGPCTDPPTAGNTQVNNSQICTGNTIYLSLNGNTYGTGQTYTWQSSSDSTNWNDINGAYQPTYSTNSVNVTTYYRCKLNCGSGTSFSTPVKVFVIPSNLCYCNTGLQTNLCDNNTGILGVEVVWENFINYNQCTNGGAAYTSFPTTVATDNFGLGQTYTVRVLVNSNAYISMWIDYNQNGLYETNEYTLVASNQLAGNPADAAFTIPQTALLGETGMRIRAKGTSMTSADACTNFATGETQDYIITIDNSVGIKNKALKANLYIAPNPANQQLTITGRGLEGNQAECLVLGINGTIVKTEKINVNNGAVSAVINVSDLAAGIYQVIVKGSNTVLNQKLVIQR